MGACWSFPRTQGRQKPGESMPEAIQLAMRAHRVRVERPKTPEHDGCRKQLDQAVSSESVESGTMRTPSRPERNDSLHCHPGDGENLKLKNASRDIRQLSRCGCGHGVFRVILLIRPCSSKTETAG